MLLVLLISVPILLALDILVALFGADSRPGFSDGRTDVKESWFAGDPYY